MDEGMQLDAVYGQGDPAIHLYFYFLETVGHFGLVWPCKPPQLPTSRHLHLPKTAPTQNSCVSVFGNIDILKLWKNVAPGKIVFIYLYIGIRLFEYQSIVPNNHLEHAHGTNVASYCGG